MSLQSCFFFFFR